MTNYAPAPAGYVPQPGDAVRITETETATRENSATTPVTTVETVLRRVYEGVVDYVSTGYDSAIVHFVGATMLAYAADVLADVPDENVVVAIEIAVDPLDDPERHSTTTRRRSTPRRSYALLAA